MDINQHLILNTNTNTNTNPNTNPNSNPNDYLKKVYHLVITQFGVMSDYHSDNLTWYKYLNVPSLNNLINYIGEIPPDINQTKKWLSEIKNENVGPNNYLNSINHHLIITPFISFYNLPPEIKKIIEHLEKLDNLWIEQIDTFNYRSIDIVKFFKIWNEALIKINLNSKTTKINEIILNNI